MAQATVLSVTGNAVVVQADGTTRALKVGDVIQKGETVRTAAGARVELMMEDGQVVAMGPAQTVRVDETMAQTDATPSAAEAAAQPGTIDQIAQVLEQGGDLTEELEAAAAGAGAGGGGDGSDFVRLLRVTEGVDPLAYDYSFDPLAGPDEVLLASDADLPPPNELSDEGESVTTEEDQEARGNVLDNTVNPDGPATEAVVQFTWGGQTANAGDPIRIQGVGTLTIAPNGDFVFTPDQNYDGQVPPATYDVTDGEDAVTSTLSIQITPVNDPPTLVVDDNPNLPGNTGDTDVVNESALATGSGGGTAVATGTITVGDADGLDDIKTITFSDTGAAGLTFTVGSGSLADLVNQTFTTANGTVKINSYSVVDGKGVYGYEYTLTSRTADVADQTETNSFKVTVDDGTATANATVTIEIVDDVPQTGADGTATVTEDSGAGQTVTANVLTNDSYGADDTGGLKAFSWDANTAAKAVLATYGTLTLGTDGQYTFTLNNASAAVQALTASGTPIQQTLTYTITDADGDTSPGSVIIKIVGADDSASVTVATQGADSTVYEAGLTSVANTSETDSDSFQVNATDGIASVTIGTGSGAITLTLGQLTNLGGVAAVDKTYDTGEGTLVVTGFNSTDGKTGTVSYSYTLKAAQTHDKATADTAISDSVPVAVAGVGGTGASANLSISIVD
ncbi:retention module-containing protein, partial [Aquabacterium sp. A08]|uniref:retention module-containing protein n=1 Tax=Aquabacterium sp. A08 TaxID=2718532 RepID=UPI0014202EF3